MRARASTLEKVVAVMSGQSGRRSRFSRRRFVMYRVISEAHVAARGVDLVRL